MKKLTVYTDGGYFENENIITWAWLVTDGENIIEMRQGRENAGGRGNYDVEKAESTAMKEAIDWIKEHPDNYVVITDSKALISKIEKRCANATKDPAVPYIQRTIAEFKNSPLPVSLSFDWKKRRSDKWMCRVDDACGL
jgi:ribonuclease HI